MATKGNNYTYKYDSDNSNCVIVSIMHGQLPAIITSMLVLVQLIVKATFISLSDTEDKALTKNGRFHFVSSGKSSRNNVLSKCENDVIICSLHVY